MTLAAGSRLGPYEILSPLGAGGMGEVYKARDSRLERTVAVKVLPSHLSASAETRQRFEREAKTISQLTHAHICALYDVGSANGVEYLVMELLDGETLSDRLRHGALPLEQTLRYGTEIADALDRAHRQGIVHRDLKPANVMITKAGVKLLDFGLAKAMAPAAPAGNLTALPTQQELTHEGTILGTFQYMSPEQLEGKEADSRSDIFALGAVLYEMATGKKAFSGTSQASLISAIMKEDPPPVSTIQAMSPPALDRVVKTCLAKDPEDRWQSAHDVGNELEWIAEGSQAAVLTAAGSRNKRERLAWWMAGLLLLGLGASVLSNLRRPALVRSPTRFSVLAPAGESFSRSFAVSPDGRKLAFATFANGSPLWVHSYETGASKRLAGTEEARYPFWSPDGKSLGFFAQGKLKKIDLSGGPPQVLADASDPRGGSWGSGGTILFSPGAVSPLYLIPAGGGAAVPATTLDVAGQENTHRWPWLLPDGKRFLMYVGSGKQEGRGVYLGTLGSPTRKKILPDVSQAQYSPAGLILFRRQSALMAQGFDPDRVALLGEPATVEESVQGDPVFVAGAVFSVSSSGVLAYRGGETEQSNYVWMDRNGKEIGAVADSENMSEPSLSPDETRVAWHRSDLQSGNEDIWIHDLARNTSSRFTFYPADFASPVWSPDGSRILFASSRMGGHQVYEKMATGAAEEKPLFQQDGDAYPDDLSLDGKFLLYEMYSPAGNVDLWAFPLKGDGKPIPYLRSPSNEVHSKFSPDGRWVAYVSDETGIPEIFVQSFPASGGKWQISRGGGAQPAWRRDGKELFFLGLDRKMMSVPVTTVPTFEPGAPRALFDTVVPNVGVSSDRNHYVVTGDGQRFLIRKLRDEKGPSVITTVLDWPSALARK